MTEIENVRVLLHRLKERLIGGEIDEATYDRLEAKLTAGLSAVECRELGVTPTPPPRSGVSSASGIGPSGERTRMPQHADLSFEPGHVLLGQWRIVRELGRGGFGAVFEAEELNLKETHAVKVLDPRMVR
jgi:hypothetical protein